MPSSTGRSIENRMERPFLMPLTRHYQSLCRKLKVGLPGGSGHLSRGRFSLGQSFTGWQ